jgi:hypothetical protein
MHYVTHRSCRMQKHKFGIMCPDTFFVKYVSVPPEVEKECIAISGLGHNRMHYVTFGSHQIEKHKFNVTCPDAFFVESVLVPPKLEK